jgi:hypothetical protein
MGRLISSMEGGIIGVWFPQDKTLAYTQRLEFHIVFLPHKGVVGILSDFMPIIWGRGHSRRDSNSRGRMNNQKFDVLALSNLPDHGSMNTPPLNTGD